MAQQMVAGRAGPCCFKSECRDRRPDACESLASGVTVSGLRNMPGNHPRPPAASRSASADSGPLGQFSQALDFSRRKVPPRRPRSATCARDQNTPDAVGVHHGCMSRSRARTNAAAGPCPSQRPRTGPKRSKATHRDNRSKRSVFRQNSAAQQNKPLRPCGNRCRQASHKACKACAAGAESMSGACLSVRGPAASSVM